MNWQLTQSGRDHIISGPESTHPDNCLTVQEIAHSLAQINRYIGHARRPYSVAEHSLLVLSIARQHYAPPAVQLAALMHDAHEAITGDVPSPIKAELGAVWHTFEWKHQKHLLEQFDLLAVYLAHKDQIKRWDLIALATERHQLTSYNPQHNLPWPVLDTPGCEVPPHRGINLNAEWRETNTWETWAHVFALQFDMVSKEVAQEATARAAA